MALELLTHLPLYKIEFAEEFRSDTDMRRQLKARMVRGCAEPASSAPMAPSPIHDSPSTDVPAGASVVESLSARFRIPLRRIFAKRGIPMDDVDDLVQDVFVRIASRTDIASVERLQGYLFSTAANLLRDRHRRLTFQSADAHEPYDESTHGNAVETQGPERSLLAMQRAARLFEALFELPERTRTMFTLYSIEDLPYQEISRRLGIAASYAEAHHASCDLDLRTPATPPGPTAVGGTANRTPISSSR